MKVDVCIVTKHPDKIDGWNHTDSIPVNNVIIESSAPLALARKRAIQKVSTDWFVFMDDDIFLHLFYWWENISKYISDDVGAIQGTAIPIGLGRHYDKAFKDHFLNVPDVRELNGNSRMYTHNTLIRTASVMDWNPPDDLEAYEDYHMMKHIQDRSYKILVVKTETYHLYTWRRAWKATRWGTQGRMRFFPKRDIARDFFKIPFVLFNDGIALGFFRCFRRTAAMYELVTSELKRTLV